VRQTNLAPGSFVARSHLVAPDPQLRKQLTDIMLTATEGNWGRVRTRAEVEQLFAGLEVIPPGLVEITTWRASLIMHWATALRGRGSLAGNQREPRPGRSAGLPLRLVSRVLGKLHATCAGAAASSRQ
jgi:hypothetical protein